MDKLSRNIDFESIHQVFTLLGSCTDDYLFIYDLQLDQYTISESAVSRFALRTSQFSEATKILCDLCYPDDYPVLYQNIQGIINGDVKKHDMEYRWIGKTGEAIWISCRGQVIHDDEKKAHYLVGRISELGRRNKIDSITGLYREVSLRAELVERQKQDMEKSFLLLIGIDNFREINDKYGKHFGDEVLVGVSECMRECIGDSGKIFRMDGDEFMAIIDDPILNKIDPAKELYHRIRKKLDSFISENGYQHFHTISGGGAYFAKKDEASISLIEEAEFALHQAKNRGKNTYVTYEEKEYQIFAQKLEMQERLRESVEENFRGFSLNYQPIVNIEKRKILGAETLLRWEDEKLGKISPAEFIPLLEESGLIIPVGRWIIRTAMQQCLKWQKQDHDFRININLSFIQLKKSDIIKDIEEIMQELGYKSSNVLFEVTESGELESGAITRRVLESFQKRNLNLAIDDFGTGYSNLRYIKEMMFNLVKIDQAFIRNITNSQYDYLVVKQFTELAHSLNLKVCYEGVETLDDLECVLELKPDYIQGFYFAKPVTADEFEENYLCKIENF